MYRSNSSGETTIFSNGRKDPRKGGCDAVIDLEAGGNEVRAKGGDNQRPDQKVDFR